MNELKYSEWPLNSFEAIVVGRLRARGVGGGGAGGRNTKIVAGQFGNSCSPLVASAGSKQSSEAHVLHEEENWVMTVTVARK